MNVTYKAPNCHNCTLNCFINKIKDTESLAEINESKRDLMYYKGETIVKQGTYTANLFYIRKGLVKTLVEGGNNKSLTINFKPSDSYLAYPSTENNSFYPFTAITIVESEVCMVKKETIQQLTDKFPEINRQVANLYEFDFRFLYNKLMVLGTKNMPGRLAEALIYLSDSALQNENIYQHITRRDIAELAGMSHESMLKLLQELKSDKVINTVGKVIEIEDLDLLNRLRRIG